MERHCYIHLGHFRFDLKEVTVEPVLFLYMFSNYLYFPSIQALIFDKVCLQKYVPSFCKELQNNETYKKEHETEDHYISSETSYWILKTNIALTVPSFFVVILFLGVLGDKVGRKIPLLLPCVGAFATYLSGLLNAKYMTGSLYYILIGPILNGLCGGYIACMGAVYSYISHVSTPTKRMKRIGIVEAMIYLAGTIGVFTSGVMLDNQGYNFTFSVMCIAIVIAFIYTAVWLDNVKPVAPSSGNYSPRKCDWLLGFFKDSFQCVTRRREGHIFTALILQVVTLDVLMLCTSGDLDISLVYLKESLNFSQTLYGYYKGLDNFLRGLILVSILPLIKMLTTIKNLPLVLFGLTSYAASFVIVGAASAKWMVFLAAVAGMFKGLPAAGLRATMSSMVSNEEQGRLFGLIAASESLIALLASVLFNELYPATYSIYPGLCFMLAAGLVFLVFLVIMYLHCTLPAALLSPRYQTIEENAQDNSSVITVSSTQELDA